ncbi:unnamed protein product [Tilletia controversa]|nr:unnamed protein product [Tilletia controversa]
MSGPKYSAKLVYGSLPVVGAADPVKSPLPYQFRRQTTSKFLDLPSTVSGRVCDSPLPTEAPSSTWFSFAMLSRSRPGPASASGFSTLAHRGTLFYVVLFRDAQSLEAGPSFCQRVFDGVKDTWHTDKAGKFWSDRNNYSHMHAGSSVIVQLEDELFELVRGALPHLLERATDRRQGSLTGSQLWAEVTADADAAGRPRVTLVGDIFRELVHNDLPLLSDTDFPHIPRHDLSAVDGYIGVITDAICIVASQQLNSVHSH